MNRKILAILVASVAAAAMPATCWAGQGGGGKGGESHGGPGGSSGQGKGGGKAGGAGFASGKSKSDLKETGRAFAPGQMKKAAVDVDDDDDVIATGSFGKVNFGTVISSIRAGKSSLAGVDADTVVNVVDVADLIRGNNRVALDNALAARADEIDDLQDDLAALGLTDLDQATIDDVVAIRPARNGSLTVFVYEN
jgi:hypothetical protein